MRHRVAWYVGIFTFVLAGCGQTPGLISPLAIAARQGDVAAIAAAAAAGDDINAVDPGSNRWTPLLHAIHKGRRDSVTALIAARADVNRGAPGGLTPLMMAVGNGQTDIVRALLAAGADPGTEASEVLAVAVSGGALTDIENPLLGRCNTDVVRLLVKRTPGVRLPHSIRGRAALWIARLNHCGEVLSMVRPG